MKSAKLRQRLTRWWQRLTRWWQRLTRWWQRLTRWMIEPIRGRTTSFASLNSFIDTIVLDKDLQPPRDSRERLSLFFRGLPRIGGIATSLLTALGLIWVAFYYGSFHHFPEIKTVGDISTLLLIGLTGSVFSVVLCSFLLLSGFVLSQGKRTHRASDQVYFAPRILYFVFFGIALISLIQLYRFLFLKSPGLWNVLIAVGFTLLAPLLITALISTFNGHLRRQFFSHLVNFLSASICWGLSASFAALLLYYNIDKAYLQNLATAFSVLLAIAFVIFAALPVFLGGVGAIGAYVLLLYVLAISVPSVIRDAPFKIWNIGSVWKRVQFLNKDEENSYRHRCYISSSYKHDPKIEQAYIVYIYSNLPGEIWYRCDTHRLQNGQFSLPRRFDPNKVLIEDIGGSTDQEPKPEVTPNVTPPGTRHSTGELLARKVSDGRQAEPRT